MAVKQFLFFGANASLPVRLIRDASKLGTGLDDMQIAFILSATNLSLI